MRNLLFDKKIPTINNFDFIKEKMSGEQKYLRFEADRICLTLDLINSKLNRDFMEKLDKVCIKHNVIPSVIKDSRLDKKVVQNCYKDFESFKEKLFNI